MSAVINSPVPYRPQAVAAPHESKRQCDRLRERELEELSDLGTTGKTCLYIPRAMMISVSVVSCNNFSACLIPGTPSTIHMTTERETETVSHVGGGDLVMREVQTWMSRVSGLVLIPVLTLLGVPGNIVSAVVFYRQGLRERINLCLFALAIVDLVALLGFFLPNFETQIRELFLVNSFILAKISPNLVGFVWASQFLSAVIASERCFCVVSPFHAKRLLKTSTMAAIIVVCCLILVGGMCAIAGPKYTIMDIFDPSTNTSSSIFYVTSYYLDNRDILDIIDVYIYATALSGLFLLVIIVTTSITVITLWSAMSQRESMTSNDGANNRSKFTGRLSRKEMTVTKMLVGTSVLFIICWTPSFVVQIISITSKPQLGGRTPLYLYLALYVLVSVFRAVSVSTPVLFYYVVGSKFRHVLHELCRCHDVRKWDSSNNTYISAFSS